MKALKALIQISLATWVTIFGTYVYAADNQQLVGVKIVSSRLQSFNLQDFRKQLEIQRPASTLNSETIKQAFLKKSNQVKSAQGGADAGGGDPISIASRSFPDGEKLKSALEFIAQQILRSHYPENLKSFILSELIEVYLQDRFRVLPALLILTKDSRVGGYGLPSESDHFIALGGMTEFNNSAPIYLAQRTVEYPKEKLAELILHETLHHVLSHSLTSDEEYVDALAVSLLKDGDDQALSLALERGFFFRSDTILVPQFIQAFRSRLEPLIWVINGDPKVDQFISAGIHEIEVSLIEKFGNNIADRTFKEVLIQIINGLFSIKPSVRLLAMAQPQLLKISVAKSLRDLAQQLQPSNELLTNPTLAIGYKVRHSRKANLDCLFDEESECHGEPVLMKDYFAQP